MMFVKLVITEDFPEYLWDQTNLYASKVNGAAPEPFTKHSLFQTWTPVIAPEVKTFWRLMFVSGITVKSNLKLKWTEDPGFETSIFSKTVAPNHSERILSFLRFSESSVYNTSTHWLYKKKRPVLEWPKFSMVHIPEQKTLIKIC
jgi:hypothetical protein